MSRFSQFVALATGHLAHRHSLRDVVANLRAQGSRLYHLGVQPVARSSFARLGSIVVFDKEYSDYGWRQKLTDAGVYFVTRARGNMVAKVIEEGPPARDQIGFDRRVQLVGKQKHGHRLKPLRLVGYR